MKNVVQFACECDRESCKAPEHEFQRCNATAMISRFPGSDAPTPSGWAQSIEQPGALLCPSCAEVERAEHAKTQ
jgi:hypothetical protein